MNLVKLKPGAKCAKGRITATGAIGYQSALAWTVALVIYQGGRILGLVG